SLVAEAEAGAGPADDAAPLAEGPSDADFGDDAPGTDLSTLDVVLDGLADAFPRAGSSATELSGYAEHRLVTTYLASSTGLRRRHVQPTGALQLVGRREGRSAWAGTGTATFTDVGLETLEAQVLQGLEWAARRIEVPPGRYEVLLPPCAVADFMMFVLGAAGATDSEEGRTVFSKPGGGTRIGERLTPLPFDLWSDPQAAGIECEPFLATIASTADVSVYDNGMPLTRTDWLRAGRLEHLLRHRAGAARAGAPATGPIDNIVLTLPGAAGTLDDLVARTERGLLLTCLWYIREVDPKTLLLTGLTRDGVYVVEDGEVVGAANNFRFNESPIDCLARATEASETVRTLGREGGSWVNRTSMPALRVPSFNMSSVSQAV
ncbi:MAG: metallopeptidase TldD-related protein, partial [Acidimicrobiales bacterium]